MNSDERRLHEAMRAGDSGAARVLLPLARRRGALALAVRCGVALGWCPPMTPIGPATIFMRPCASGEGGLEHPTPAWRLATPGQSSRRLSVSRPFWLSTTPVTQAHWRALMLRNPACDRRDPQQPVEMVSWYDAIVYCNTLSERLGLAPPYAWGPVGDEESVRWSDPRRPGVRLPTESEWLVAAWTGHLLADDAHHAHLARVAAARQHHPAPVAAHPPDGHGLFDMLGNVWCWCWDRYAHALGGEADALLDDLGPGEGWRRVVRGGSFATHGADVLRRAGFDPESAYVTVGLRVAMTGR